MRARRLTMAGAMGAVAVVLAAGCTNPDPVVGGADGSVVAGGTSAADGDRTGVTDDTIRIGWPTIDQSALVEAGLANDVGDVTGVAARIVDDWNAGGGINGRRVELVERSFGTDLANMLPDMQKVCLELTEDDEVFATVAFAWFGDAVTCIAGDHDTPLVVQTSLSNTVIESGDDNIFLVNFTWEDALRSSVRAADESGELGDAARVGVLGPLEPGVREAIDDGLAPALAAAGSELAADGTIPFATPVDSAAVAAVVSRFRAEGVDTVFAVGNFYFNGAFMTEAQKQDYHPTYVMSDLSEGTDDLLLKFAPAEQLDRAVGGEPWKGKSPDPVPTAEGQACIDAYAPEARGSITAELGAAQTCEFLDVARRGLEGAGESPTRGGFIDALEGVGFLTVSGGGTGSFSPQDHSLPDQVRLVRFDLEGCQCWASEGDWIDVDS